MLLGSHQHTVLPATVSVFQATGQERRNNDQLEINQFMYYVVLTYYILALSAKRVIFTVDNITVLKCKLYSTASLPQ